MSTSPPPLSEQTYAKPPWRTNTPPLFKAQPQTATTAPPTKVRATIWDLPPSGQPKTIWDPPSPTNNQKLPPKFPPAPVQPPVLPTGCDNKPQYNPVTTQHFSFPTKSPPTRPGAITPTYVTDSPRITARALSNRSNLLANGDTVSKGQESLSKSQTSLKSCLKTENKSYQPGTIFNRTRSESPAGRAPYKQNVNFKTSRKKSFSIMIIEIV